MTSPPLRNLLKLAGLLPAAALLLACGGDWDAYDPDTARLPADKVQALAYPSAHVGTKVGDVVADIKFDYVFYDPMFQCKNPKDDDITLSDGPVPLALSDLYQGHALCGKKKQLVWLMASAGW